MSDDVPEGNVNVFTFTITAEAVVTDGPYVPPVTEDEVDE